MVTNYIYIYQRKYGFFFFFVQGVGSKTPVLRFYNSTWQVQFTKRSFSTLALKDLIFEERTFDFTKSTLELKIETQSSPWAPPPHLAGDLQAKPPRSLELMSLGLSFPTSIHKRQQTRGIRGRTTWMLLIAEHWRCRERASAMEVEHRPPSWPQSATASLSIA